MARIIIAVPLCLLFATVTACAAPLSNFPPVAGAPYDSFAPAGANLSLDPTHVAVHVTQLGGDTEQINVFNTSGTLLFAAVTNGVNAQVLPFGSLARFVNVAPSAVSDSVGLKDQAGGPVTCPCNARIIYQDPSVTIIAVFGADGNIAYSYMVMRTVQR